MKPLLVSLTVMLFGFCMIGLAQSVDNTEAFIEQVQSTGLEGVPWDGSLEDIDIDIPGISDILKNYFEDAKSLYSPGWVGNRAFIYQQSGGTGNSAHVTQIGTGHFFFGAQDGMGNEMSSTLLGNNNMAIMLQKGDDNKADLRFNGEFDQFLGGIIIQDGSGNIFDQEISGVSDQLYKVIQKGDGNILNLIDNTGFALPMEIRQTGGARLMLINGPIPIR